MSNKNNSIHSTSMASNSTTATHHTCIFCKSTFSQAPAEHILQNSLGTTWTCSSFMCPQCQSLFGGEPDVAVGEFSIFFRNILNIGTGREPKKVPSIPNATDSDGHKYILRPGFTPELQEPYFEVLHDSIRLITPKRKDHERWCKHMAEKAGYQLGAEIYRTIESGGLSHIHAQVNFSLTNFSIALLKSAFNLIGAIDINIALHSSFDELRKELLASDTNSSSKRVCCIEPAALPHDSFSLFAHQVYVFSSQNEVAAIMRLFGGVSFKLILSNQYNGSPFCFVYISDPLRQKPKLVETDYKPELIEKLSTHEASDFCFGECKFYRCVQMGYDLFMYKTIANNFIYPLTRSDNLSAQRFFTCLFETIMPEINGQIFNELSNGSFLRFESFMKQVIHRMHDIIKETVIE